MRLAVPSDRYANCQLERVDRRTLDYCRHLRCFYDLRTVWSVPGTAQEVAEMFLQSDSMPIWWRTFSQVAIVEPGVAHALGRVVRVHAQSLLPYSLQFRCRVIEVQFPYYFALRVCGDFSGYATASLQQQGAHVGVNFRWLVRVRKPFLRKWSFLLKPFFILNHRWSMLRGREGLRRELHRRRFTLSDVGE